MYRYRHAVSILLTFLVALAFPPDSEADDNPPTRILYINSYHRGYSWSDGIEQGLREGLEASDRKLEISIEYLDSRRFAYGAQMEPLAQAMAIKYAAYRPSLVVVSDNAAFDFAIKYRQRLFPNQPIVFCGYNNFRPDVLTGIRNLTGINEEISIEDTVTMALKVHPDTRTLAFITSTGEASSKRIGEVAEQSVFPKLRERFQVVELKDASVEEIRQRLAQLPPNTLLFLSGQARDQGAGRALSPPENGRLITGVSPFPAYTFWDFHLGQGAIGGHILTGPEQGRAAARLALQVLAGTAADDIPVVMTSPTSDVFDYPVLERFGVKVSDLPLGARIINRPFSPWDAYRWQIIGLFFLLVAETLLIALLVRVVRGRRQALDDLARERTQLEQRVQDRTRELKAANDLLAQLSFTDGLTGLANRRRFDEVLESEFLRLRRSGASLSLILLDVDHFKHFNDALGHVAGDDCLRRIGEVIARQIRRAPDLAARYGGEEFAVILPETDIEAATTFAQRIHAAILELAIAHPASAASPLVTVSQGIATTAAASLTSARDLVRQADEQLYLAKSGGRNRIAVCSLVATHPAAG